MTRAFLAFLVFWATLAAACAALVGSLAYAVVWFTVYIINGAR